MSDTVAIFASTSSDGIVVIWEMEIEPTTPGGKIASLWIANITVRSIIFCHAGLTIQTLILFYFMILTVLGNVHCICA